VMHPAAAGRGRSRACAPQMAGTDARFRSNQRWLARNTKPQSKLAHRQGNWRVTSTRDQFQLEDRPEPTLPWKVIGPTAVKSQTRGPRLLGQGAALQASIRRAAGAWCGPDS